MLDISKRFKMLNCNILAAQLQILSVFYESFSGTECQK